jgi:hypothetical protein
MRLRKNSIFLDVQAILNADGMFIQSSQHVRSGGGAGSKILKSE